MTICSICLGEPKEIPKITYILDRELTLITLS